MSWPRKKEQPHHCHFHPLVITRYRTAVFEIPTTATWVYMVFNYWRGRPARRSSSMSWNTKTIPWSGMKRLLPLFDQTLKHQKRGKK